MADLGTIGRGVFELQTLTGYPTVSVATRTNVATVKSKPFMPVTFTRSMKSATKRYVWKQVPVPATSLFNSVGNSLPDYRQNTRMFVVF